MSRIAVTAAVLMLMTFAAPVHAEDTIVINGTPLTATQMKMFEAPSRPALLPVLYASYAGLQAYDIYSTRQALSRGAREANPLMQGAANSSAAMIGLKAGVVVGTIVAAERMWKNNNKVGAIAVLVASNSGAAFVAARNARTLQTLR